MPLEVPYPLPPMEALSVEAIPEGGDWQYEPKWDGFRCVAFRDGGSVHLQSKSLQPLARYFPEVAEALAELEAKHFVLDGEIAVPEGRGFSFDALLQRIHPAVSRVKRLAAETPAIYVVFDLLAVDDGKALLSMSLRERRARLEQFSAQYFGKGGLIRLSPATDKLAQAKKWLSHRVRTRRPKPLESGEGKYLAATAAQTRHRGLLRSCHRQPLPPRYQTSALATRQGTRAMHDGSICPEKVRSPPVAQIVAVMR